MWHGLMNLINTTFFKHVWLIITDEHLWVGTTFMCLHIPISLACYVICFWLEIGPLSFPRFSTQFSNQFLHLVYTTTLLFTLTSKKLKFCPFWTKKEHTLLSQNWHFSQFYVNQSFSVEDTRCRKSNFLFVLLMKIWKKPSKGGCLKKFSLLPWLYKKLEIFQPRMCDNVKVCRCILNCNEVGRPSCGL